MTFSLVFKKNECVAIVLSQPIREIQADRIFNTLQANTYFSTATTSFVKAAEQVGLKKMYS